MEICSARSMPSELFESIIDYFFDSYKILFLYIYSNLAGHPFQKPNISLCIILHILIYNISLIFK